MKRMSENAARVYDYDFAGQPAEMSVEERSFWIWLRARLYDLGILEAMAPSTKPPELRVNYTTILFYLAVLSAIAGGFLWTWQRGQESGIAIGETRAEKKALEEKMADEKRDHDKQISELKEEIDILKDTDSAKKQKEKK